MAKHIKSFLSIILFALVFNGCSNKSNMFRAAYDNRCANFILNVYPTYADQGPGQGITVGGATGRIPGISGGGVRVGGQSVHLQLQFQVRRIYAGGRGLTVTGQGKATSFDFGIEATVDRLNIPVRYDHEAYRPGSAHKLVQDAVRDTFERLREVMSGQYEPWKGLVSDVTPEGHITIQTEPGDNFKPGDIFRVFPIGGPNSGGYNNAYSGGGYNNNYGGRGYNNYGGGTPVSHPSCNFRRGNNQQSIAMARLVEADEFHSTLEIASDQTGGQRPVQIGDFVESMIRPNETDEDERRRVSARKVMRLGFVRPFLLHFRPRPNSRYFNRPVDLTAFLESAVLTEAPNYGFDIIY